MRCFLEENNKTLKIREVRARKATSLLWYFSKKAHYPSRIMKKNIKFDLKDSLQKYLNSLPQNW